MAFCMDREPAELYLLKPQDKILRVGFARLAVQAEWWERLYLCIGKCRKIYGCGQNVVAHREFRAGRFGMNHRVMNLAIDVQEKKEKRFPSCFLLSGK